jgi:hypothetical protein
VSRERDPAQRAALILAHLLFAGLLVLAWKHAVARMVHVDSAWQFFQWTQRDGITVEAHRYTAMLPQLLVKAGMALGLSLGALLVLASVAHVLVGLGVFLVCAHLLKAPRAALACALATVLCTRLAFYGPVLEANQLTAYPFLLLALLERYPAPWAWHHRALALVLLAPPLLVHPVGWAVMAAALAFLFAWSPGQRRELGWLMAACLVWGLAARVVLPPTAYEAGLYGSLARAAGDGGPGGAWASWRFLVDHSGCATAHFVPVWTVMLALVVALVRGRRWWVLGVLAGGWGAYIAVNLATYAGGEHALMMEKNFVPLATLVALPAITVAWGTTGLTRWACLLALALLLFAKFRDIAFAGRPAEQRISALRTALAWSPADRLILDHADLQRIGIGVHWALPFETLLITALDGPEKARTAVCATETGVRPGDMDLWLGALGPRFPADRLNGRYYRMGLGGYVDVASSSPGMP